MHGYYYRKLQKNDKIDISVSQQRSRTKQITSQFEGYLGSIQDQEYQQNSWFIKDKQSLVNHQQQIINVAYAK